MLHIFICNVTWLSINNLRVKPIMDWKIFWQEYPKRSLNLDEFQQVGKTKHQKRINEDQFGILIDDIVNKLELSEEDFLLDLCCGNGLITKELSKKNKKVVGVDFSFPLIEHAKKYNNKANMDFVEYDIKDIENVSAKFNGVTKVLCYEALAFFNEDEFLKLIDDIRSITEGVALVYFASVLDYSKRFNFFNTFRRKLLYYKIKFTSIDFGLGYWWKMKAIEKICRKRKIELELFEQNELLHTSHFRTDILLKLL